MNHEKEEWLSAAPLFMLNSERISVLQNKPDSVMRGRVNISVLQNRPDSAMYGRVNDSNTEAFATLK